MSTEYVCLYARDGDRPCLCDLLTLLVLRYRRGTSEALLRKRQLRSVRCWVILASRLGRQPDRLAWESRSASGQRESRNTGHHAAQVWKCGDPTSARAFICFGSVPSMMMKFLKPMASILCLIISETTGICQTDNVFIETQNIIRVHVCVYIYYMSLLVLR